MGRNYIKWAEKVTFSAPVLRIRSSRRHAALLKLIRPLIIVTVTVAFSQLNLTHHVKNTY